MDFWLWLTSKDGLPLLVAMVGLLGTAAGITGTVITQRSIAKQTADREDRRFNYEKERHLAAAQASEKARFEEVKRAAFVKHLYNASRINYFLRQQDKLHPWIKLVADPYEPRLKNFVEDYSLSSEEITLLAPNLGDQVGKITDLLRGNITKTILDTRYPVDTEEQTDAAISALRIKMQQNLGIDLANGYEHDQLQLNGANQPGTSKPTQP